MAIENKQLYSGVFDVKIIIIWQSLLKLQSILSPSPSPFISFKKTITIQ